MTPEIDFQMNFEASEQAEADKKLVAMFFRSAIKNEAKSVEAGRPIFDEVDLIKIITPGSRDNFIGDATPEYQMRFPRQWDAYKKNMDQASASGTPLNQLPWLGVGQIAEFNAMNVYTVEQLVAMPDAISQKFMGHHAIKQRAKLYLDAAKDAAPMLKLQDELRKRDEQLEELRQQVALMQQAQAESAKKMKG